MHTEFWSGKLKGRDYSRDLCLDGRIILELILKRSGIWKCGLDSSGIGYGSMMGSCEHGNEFSDSTKDENFY